MKRAGTADYKTLGRDSTGEKERNSWLVSYLVCKNKPAPVHWMKGNIFLKQPACSQGYDNCGCCRLLVVTSVADAVLNTDVEDGI